jgi:fluoride exporter
VRPSLLALVFAGGCVGGLARHGLSVALPVSGGWPWGTLVANTLGAFLLAALLVLLLERWAAPGWVRPAVGTGVLGSFTTMSAVVVTVDTLAADRQVAAAAGFLAVSMVAGLAAAVAGVVLARTATTGRTARRRS